jgi:hypothetical protein
MDNHQSISSYISITFLIGYVFDGFIVWNFTLRSWVTSVLIAHHSEFEYGTVPQQSDRYPVLLTVGFGRQ